MSADPNGHDVRARLGDVDFEALIRSAARQSGFRGAPESWRLILTGYEDCNVVICDRDQRAFVKFFATTRDRQACESYVLATTRAMGAGVRHPRLIPSFESGELLHEIVIGGRTFLACSMEFVAAPSLYERSRDLTSIELDDLVDQMTRLHGLEAEPTTIYDRWSAVNARREFEQFRAHLGADHDAVAEAVERFDLVELGALPHALVHADLVPTNLLCPGNGTVQVIDFGRADRLPRIHDVAVLVAYTLVHPDGSGLDDDVVERVIEAYRSRRMLDHCEVEAIRPYVAAVSAACVVGALASALHGDDTVENAYWLTRGRRVLAQALELWSA